MKVQVLSRVNKHPKFNGYSAVLPLRALAKLAQVPLQAA